ncbi:glycolate oxidase subunit GlcF [Immundisolibacter sp.]|uniref:glycolate oxidase subunit GlcF n=1 Tax=Immundisolibacter sp. TaxID=1934948 RepID=UPI002622AE7C|nr:glycolate oxidase subunit GlcF [Immundisolibacter sp.]MDD3652210.1 glycolate oxidase subunit GlcF [Immundisolibacter sp.]
MQTRFPEQVRASGEGAAVERIVRKCVHCGFCNVTCPTFQVRRDELDGPRGRIYQIKHAIETASVPASLRTHLDRCLTCRACETTCPAGVEYGRVLDFGRELAERAAPRGTGERLLRRALRWALPHRRRFATLLGLGRWVKPLLPATVRRSIPRSRPAGPWPSTRQPRRMLLLAGCVQDALEPRINAAAARVLDRLGITLESVAGAGCCGAISHHLTATDEAAAFMRRNVDAWWPQVQAGAEAIVVTASGCAVQVKDYGRLLAHDPAYAERAAKISALARDLAQVLAAEDATGVAPAPGAPRRIAFQSPCTLQHGQRLGGVVEGLLRRAGFELAPLADGHLCCGAAGTYALLQRELSDELRTRKLASLAAAAPQLIATANIGCLVHLQAAAPVPVRHWIELLDPLA